MGGTTKLPNAWFKRRHNLSGPVLGLPVVLCFGPFTLGAGASWANATLVQRLPFPMRLVAFGWFARAVTVTPSVQGPATRNTPTAAGTAGALSASVTLTGPAGAVYWFNATGDAVYITSNQTLVSGNPTLCTNPEFGYAPPAPGVTTSSPFIRIIGTNGGSNALTDFSCYVMGWPTRHACNGSTSTDMFVVEYAPGSD